MKSHIPAAVSAEPKNAPANTLGIRRIMFAVEDIEDVLARLRAHGAELVGGLAKYEEVSALLRPRPRGHPRRARRAAQLKRSTYALLTLHDCPLEVNRKSIDRLQRKPSQHIRKPPLAMHLFHLFQGGLHRTKSPVDHLRFIAM